jgi:hypothetical protein
MKQSSASECRPEYDPKVTRYSGQNSREQAAQPTQVDRAPMPIATLESSRHSKTNPQPSSEEP